jgi:uncharacterized protein YdaU (DUF1376 family)
MPDKAPREWMAFYVLHYLGDTSDLTFEEHGAYSLTLWVAWTRGGALPGDDDGCRRALAAYVKDCGTKRFNSLVKPLLERFFYRAENGCWRNMGLEKERLKANSISSAGRQAANSRWGNPSNINDPPNAIAQRSHSVGNTKQTNLNNHSSTSSARPLRSYANEPLGTVSEEFLESIRGRQ